MRQSPIHGLEFRNSFRVGVVRRMSLVTAVDEDSKVLLGIARKVDY